MSHHPEPTPDPLHVHVPPSLTADFAAAVAADIDCPAGREMVAALGGAPHALERFLVARKLQLDAAAAMLRETLNFRADDVATLMPIDPTVRARVGKYWPCAYCRVGDKTVHMVRLGEIDPRALMKEISEEDFRTYYIHWMELCLRHQLACANAKQTEIYNLRGLSFSQLHMPGLRMLSRVLKIGQDHYCESLHRCVIVHAPRIFAIAWQVVSLVLDERTRQKTLILSGDGIETLEQVLGVERAQCEELLATRADEGSDDIKEGLAWLSTPGARAPMDAVAVE